MNNLGSIFCIVTILVASEYLEDTWISDGQVNWIDFFRFLFDFLSGTLVYLVYLVSSAKDGEVFGCPSCFRDD